MLRILLSIALFCWASISAADQRVKGHARSSIARVAGEKKKEGAKIRSAHSKKIAFANQQSAKKKKWVAQSSRTAMKKTSSQKDKAKQPRVTFKIVPAVHEQTAKGIVTTAYRFLKTAYIFGGSSPDGFDCSGFTHYVFRRHGVNIPRSSMEQARRGVRVDQAHLRMGDLVFFSTLRSGVSHVGIFIANGRFIHSAADGYGVMVSNLFSKYWDDRFVLARRFDLRGAPKQATSRVAATAYAG